MLIISAGMQKSGSGYFYNIINELIVASGNGIDAREVKHDSDLDELMKWHNNNIGSLSLTKLVRLWRVSTRKGSFVVKTHAGPNLSVRLLNNLGALRIVYCYRDPRDVLLSAIEFGKKILDSGENHTFAKMVDFDKALNIVKYWLRDWQAYASMPKVLTVKYEEMMQDPVLVTKKIEDYLNLSVDTEKRQAILWKFSKDNPDGERNGMHFNKAEIFRYKTDLSEEQQARCNNEFRRYLLAMDYEI